MKFAIIVLIAVLGVAAANGGAFRQTDTEFDYEPNDNANVDGEIEIEAVLFMSIIKTALRTVKGLNCSIKAALLMKTAAQQCLTDLQACGGQVSKQVQNVINTLNTIISLCNDIINLNSNICASNGDSTSTSKPCVLKVAAKMFSLYKNINKCISLIKKVPTAGANASDCVTTALSKVSSTFVQFPTYVTNCSKLTS